MPKIVWDATGERQFETGVDHAVLYVRDNTGAYPAGVPWNGIVSVNDSPEGAESNPQYADNIKYLNLVSAEEAKGTIEAFMWPDEFNACDGTAEPVEGMSIGQQGRKTFGLAYRTKIGNDVEGQNAGYKLHIVYGALAAPSEKEYSTINDSPEATTFSWEYSTTPVPVTGYEPTSTLTFNSTTLDPDKLAALEVLLFGGTEAGENARLPLPDEIIALLTAP